VRRSTSYSRPNAMQPPPSGFLVKALGANHPHPRVINTDKYAAYPPAIVQLKAEGVLEENCQHRPMQYLNNVLGAGSSGHQTPGPREPTFSFILGSLAYDRRLRSDSYDPQRPSVLHWGGCGGRSTAPLHSRAVRGDELNCRSSIIYADFRLDYKLATLPSPVPANALVPPM
jgi:DDE domain